LVAVGLRTVYSLGDLFSSWVGEWWPLKFAAAAAGDKVSLAYVKYMLNMLYGYQGRLDPEWGWWKTDPELVGFPPLTIVDTRAGGLGDMRTFGPHCFLRPETREPDKSCPVVAAFVTSYGRVLMDRLRSVCGESNLVYQATDSIHCFGEGLEALKAAGEVAAGELGKLEHKVTYADARYFGRNNYQVDGITKIGGRRGVATDFAQRAEKQPDGRWKQQQFEGMKRLLQRPGTSDLRVRSILKDLPGGWTRSETTPDGRLRAVRGEHWTPGSEFDPTPPDHRWVQV
jgi:hypothetical protein